MAALLIGEAAERAGVAAATIRYYESLGLLKPANRSTAGYRRYSEAVVDELRFIKKAQALGFSLQEVREILELANSGTVPCSRVLTLAQQHLAAVEERIRQLQGFRDHLASEIRKWDRQTMESCAGLCRLIVQADTSTDALTLHVNPPETRRLPRRR